MSMVHADTGRVIATPYKNDAVRLGIMLGETGLGDRIFCIVYLWPGQNGAVSGARVKPLASMPEARAWVDAHHADCLRRYRDTKG